MKIELEFPFDFARVCLALEAPEVICRILIPNPVTIFRLRPSRALSTCSNCSPLRGLAGAAGIMKGFGLTFMLINFLNETWEWGLAWAGVV